jgi:hypothetical protein
MPHGGPTAPKPSDITQRDVGKDSGKLIESMKSVTPSPPPEAEGEVKIEVEEVAGTQGPEAIGSPVVDANELMDQIEKLVGKIPPEGAHNVPPWVSNHSNVSENSSDMDVDKVVGEALTEAVEEVVKRTNDSDLD